MSNLLKNIARKVLFGSPKRQPPERDPYPGLTLPKPLPKAPIPYEAKSDPLDNFRSIGDTYARFQETRETSSSQKRPKWPKSLSE
jgi:hypothetical protein